MLHSNTGVAACNCRLNRLNIMTPKDVPADELYSDDLADLCQEWQSFCVVDDGQETRRDMLRRGAIQLTKSSSQQN